MLATAFASTNHADLALSQKTCEKRAVFFWRGLVDSTTARHMCMQMNICLPVATFSSIVYRLLEIWKTCLLHPPAKNLSCVCVSKHCATRVEMGFLLLRASFFHLLVKFDKDLETFIFPIGGVQSMGVPPNYE